MCWLTNGLICSVGYSLWRASDKNPLTQESPGRYRRNNWKAWRVVAKDRMYYVLLQKDGEIYLAYGYYDSEGETDPFSDDSEIFYFKRFAERTPAELQRWGVILVEDYGMENVRPWDPIAEREQAALENDGSGHGTEEGDGQSGPESQPEKETSSASSTSKYKTLTLDIVRALAAKHDTLTVEDLAPYLDVRAVTERGSSLKKELVFEDGGVEYVLRVIASVEKNGNTYIHDLDGVILFTKEYLSAVSDEDQKRLHSGDIRSGNVDHIIKATVTMDDYFTVSLPEGVWQDRFQAGEYMGTRLLRKAEDGENTDVVGMIRIEALYSSWRMDTVKEYRSLPVDGAVMTRERVQSEDGSMWYVAAIRKENCDVGYRIFLKEAYFTEEEFLEMTESVVMAPHAFY